MNKKKLILIGGGGHCKSCIDIIESISHFEIVGILDLKANIGSKVLGYPVIGSDNDIMRWGDGDHCFLITIGQLATNRLRKNIVDQINLSGSKMATVVAASARVSKYSEIGAGTVVMNGAQVNADSRIGLNVIINTQANIEHDVIVGDNCHISTGAIINGATEIGDDVFIGSGAIIANSTKVVSGSVIGMGSVVTKSIDRRGVYYGNPAKFVRAI